MDIMTLRPFDIRLELNRFEKSRQTLDWYAKKFILKYVPDTKHYLIEIDSTQTEEFDIPQAMWGSWKTPAEQLQLKHVFCRLYPKTIEVERPSFHVVEQVFPNEKSMDMQNKLYEDICRLQLWKTMQEDIKKQKDAGFHGYVCEVFAEKGYSSPLKIKRILLDRLPETQADLERKKRIEAALRILYSDSIS